MQYSTYTGTLHGKCLSSKCYDVIGCCAYLSLTRSQFSVIIRQLFEAFNNTVSTTNGEEFCRTVLSWLDQHCTLPALRPGMWGDLSHSLVSNSSLPSIAIAPPPFFLVPAPSFPSRPLYPRTAPVIPSSLFVLLACPFSLLHAPLLTPHV